MATVVDFVFKSKHGCATSKKTSKNPPQIEINVTVTALVDIYDDFRCVPGKLKIPRYKLGKFAIERRRV